MNTFTRYLFCFLATAFIVQSGIAQTVVFQNDFNAETTGWQNFESKDFINKIADGRFFFQNAGAAGYALKPITTIVDHSRDFSVETSVSYSSGTDNIPYGITFGGKDVNNFYYFGISKTGFYIVGAFIQGVHQTIVPWTNTPLIYLAPGSYTKIAVLRVGSKLQFQINGIKVTESPVVDFLGQQTGLMVSKGQGVSFDYLKIAYAPQAIQQTRRIDPVDNNAGTIAYSTGFDADDANEWVLPFIDSVKTAIADGKFKISRRANLGTTGSVTMPETWVDMSRDFLLETEATHIDGTDQQPYSVSFGILDSTESYYFSMASNYYSLGKVSGRPAKYTELIPWTTADPVQKGNLVKNKFTIVKKGGTLSLYANDQLLKTIASPVFAGHQFGVSVTGAQTVSYDYLSFKYLDNKISVNPYLKKKEAVLADVTAPVIKVTNPQVTTRGLKVVEAGDVLKVAGIATDQSGISSVTVNGVKANVDEQGNFSASISLKTGENQLLIEATDLKMNKASYPFTVSKPAATIVQKTVTNEPSGRFYALIIGVQDYVDPTINDLDQPVADATSLYNTLKQNYTFNQEDMTLLKNPTRELFFEAFESLTKKVTEEDNLLIFYAGHGNWDEVRKQGYWYPSDAKIANRATWITNADLKEYIASIPSKHTLLITDACFAGGIFKTRGISLAGADRAITELYNLPSRKAMTSGALKEVPDKSVFIEYLVKRLDQNTEKHLSSEQLFASFKTAVINNSANGQVPQFGDIREAGDEGGDFIFIKK